MPGPPKEKSKENIDVETDRSAWSDDQQEHQYYYDDAHGYETYVPDTDDDDEDDKDED